MRTPLWILIPLFILTVAGVSPAHAASLYPSLYALGATPAAPAVVAAPAPASAPVAAAPAPAAKKPEFSGKPDEPEDGKVETLIGMGKFTSGGYGGPAVRYGRVLGQDAVFFGGRGGWVINQTIVIGGAGYGMVSQVQLKKPNMLLFQNYDPYIDHKINVNVGYGGLLLEWIAASKRLFHVQVGAIVGGGGANLIEVDSAGNDVGGNNQPSDDFFIMEPEVHAEVNLASFMRLDLGGSYRVVTGLNGVGLKNSDLSGPAGSLMLKFGNYGQETHD